MVSFANRSIVPNQHILLKYVSTEKYARDFMDGILYMNSLEFFWNEFNVAKEQIEVNGQRDLFEGTYCNVDALRFGFPEDFCNALATDVSIRAEGYRYCHVHCYYRLDYWINGMTVSFDTNDLMNDFGKYVIIIEDEQKFLRRVDKAAKAKGVEYLCGNVRYHKPMKNGKNANYKHGMVVKLQDVLVDITAPVYSEMITGKRDAFDKMDSMSYQNEWRIAAYDGKKNSGADTLLIEEGIWDIAHMVKAEDVVDSVKKLFTERKIMPGSVGWFGNISRRDMREKFYSLGDNKGAVLGTIG